VTLFMFLQCAFAILLNRYSGQSDIVVSSAIAGRVHKDIEPLIGFFVNDLVLRSAIDESKSFDFLLKKSKEMILDAYGHQHIPFEMLVEALSPERSLRYNPIAQIKLDLQNNEQASLEFSGLDLEMIGQNRSIARHDLYLSINQNSEGLILSWNYSTELFFSETVERLSVNFENVLESIVADPSLLIKDLSLVSA